MSFIKISHNLDFVKKTIGVAQLNKTKRHENDICLYLVSKGTFGHRREKTCLRGFANNKGADQPAHPRRLISVFVIRFLLSIISRLATSEISIF